MSDDAAAARGDRACCAGLGLAVAAYLTYVHYAGIEPICAGVGRVRARAELELREARAGSRWPLSGSIGYAAILAAPSCRGEPPAARGGCAGPRGPASSALYLTYLELFEIDAICQWCVGSALIMAVLAVLTTLRAIASPVDG